jgi:hypothetical protein
MGCRFATSEPSTVAASQKYGGQLPTLVMIRRVAVLSPFDVLAFMTV